MGPRMLAALGDNRDRFNSAEEIQNYAGIAPVTERSGQKSSGTLALAVREVRPTDIRGMDCEDG